MNMQMFAGEPEKAEAELERLEKRMTTGNSAKHWFGRTQLDVYRGRFRSAITEFDDEVTRTRSHLDEDLADGVAVLLAQKALLLLLGPGDVATARKVEEEAASSGSHPMMLSEAYLLQGDLEQAAALVDTRENSAADVQTVLAITSAARRDALQGNHRETIAVYQKLARGDPRFRRQWLYEMAKLYLEGGELQEALSTLHTLQTTVPPVLTFSLLDLPRFALSFYYLGQVHERMGNTAAAFDAYQRFLHVWNDADPDLKQLQNARVRVAELRRGLHK